MTDYNTYRLYMAAAGASPLTGLYYGAGGFSGGGVDGSDFSQLLLEKSAAYGQRKTFAGISESMDAIFEEAASRYNVNANLLKAIGKAESGFDASVVSSAGAVGVMQLMPGTARSLGVSDPYDARQNIMGGASYIADLLDRYGGDVRLALAAYNAGSGNVEKYGGIPPFKETQNYVERVMEYAGSDITVNQTAVGACGGQEAQADAAEGLAGAGTRDYWSYLVDMMRMQMEMKLAGVFSADGSSNGEGAGLF